MTTSPLHKFVEDAASRALNLLVDNGAGKMLPVLNGSGQPFDFRPTVSQMRSQAEANRFVERVLKGCGIEFAVPRPEPQAGDRPGDVFKRSQAAWQREQAEREYSKW